MIRALRITEHAIERFKERIEVVPTSDDDIVMEMLRCLSTAKEKHFRKLHKNTCYIPTDRALFVIDNGAVVTVLKRK